MEGQTLSSRRPLQEVVSDYHRKRSAEVRSSMIKAKFGGKALSLKTSSNGMKNSNLAKVFSRGGPVGSRQWSAQEEAASGGEDYHARFRLFPYQPSTQKDAAHVSEVEGGRGSLYSYFAVRLRHHLASDHQAALCR